MCPILPHDTAAGDLTPDERALIREKIIKGDLPNEIAAEILRAFHDLGTAVAVRSSAVVEDSEEASFAGQLDTFLDIETERALLESVKRCIASTFSDRVGRYAGRLDAAPQGPGENEFRTAVLIQAMVPAIYSGVAFSADPHTGRRCVIIEGTTGTATGVSAGTVVPDRYVVNPQGRLLEERADGDSEGRPGLGKILELAATVRRICAEVGTHQDVEWAWDGEIFQILQSRPITSLAGKEIYSSKLVSDMTPGMIKPLLWSTNIIDMTENVFGRIFDSLLGGGDTGYTQLVKLIHSRVYVNVTFVSGLMRQLGLPPNFFEMVVLDELSERPRPRLSPRLLRSVFKLAGFVFRYGFYAGAIESFIDMHEKRLESFRGEDWSARGASELMQAARDLRAAHGETQWHMWISAMNMTIRRKILNRYVNSRVSGVDPGSLLAGRRGLKSLEPNRALREISLLIRKHDRSLPEEMVAADEGSIRALLEEDPGGREITAAFDRFMDRYGFLSTHGTDFSVPPWKENPHMIWNGIGRLAMGSDRDAENDENAARAERVDTERLIESRLNPFRRLLFRKLHSSTLRYLDYRERMSFYMSEDVYQMRRIYLEAGERLAETGALDAKDDIFFCDFEEIYGMEKGALDSETIRALVAERKNEFARDEEVELDDIICDKSAALLPLSYKTGPYLSGIAGSTGIIRGYAVVVKDPADVKRALSKGDVLVVPFTDVGWTPLFPSIGGLVAETGGQLSHSAIIAREYGIPAVVSVKKATRLLRSGQPVTVDGNSGRVYPDHIPTREGEL